MKKTLLRIMGEQGNALAAIVACSVITIAESLVVLSKGSL